MISYLKELVSIDSVNPELVKGGVGESEIAAKLAQICEEDLALNVEVQEVTAGRPNVIAHWPGTGEGKSLLLTGHMDVVGVADYHGEPFSPHVSAGQLYGRGSYDMKGGIAAILTAISSLQESNYRPAGDIWLGFVCDEEFASRGTEDLVLRLQPDAAILTEPTEEIISIAHRGFAWIVISTEGLATHGSDHVHGRDAILHMAPILEQIRVLEEEIYPQIQHPLLGRPSVHASLIQGGSGLSTYPDSCELWIEHRTLPGESGDQIVKEWQNFIQNEKEHRHDFGAKVRLNLERPPLELEATQPIVQALAKAHTNCFHNPAPIGASFGWLDSAILVAAGIPTVIFGPKGQGAHTTEEWVDLASVERCATVIAECCQIWCS